MIDVALRPRQIHATFVDGAMGGRKAVVTFETDGGKVNVVMPLVQAEELATKIQEEFELERVREMEECVRMEYAVAEPAA